MFAASFAPVVPVRAGVDVACEVVVVEADVDVDPAAPLEMVAEVTQEEEEGAGCGGGVLPSPWWKVEPPYTPMG